MDESRRALLGGLAGLFVLGCSGPAGSDGEGPGNGPVVAEPAVSPGGVLVLGGTGQLGARIVQLLLDAGETVTVFVRPASNRTRLEGLEVAYVVGDLLNERDVAAAFEGGVYRVVINAVRAPITDTPFYDITSGHVARYAKAHGVEQIIHHGAVGAGENMALHPDVPWDRVPGLKARMEDHGKAERNFLNSGIATTVIRNSRVWPDETPASGHATLTEDQSVLTPITRQDLAAMTLQCLDNPECFNKIYHASDDTLTWPPPGMGE
jgi:uncharacterized protein YbjT (DUF2867 family)